MNLIYLMGFISFIFVHKINFENIIIPPIVKIGTSSL